MRRTGIQSVTLLSVPIAEAVCFLLNLFGRLPFVLFFGLPMLRSRRGHCACGAARSVGTHSTWPLPARPTHSGMQSGNATSSEVQASAAESSLSTGLGCSHEELLALIWEEFHTLQQQVPDVSTQPPVLLSLSSPAGGLQLGYSNCIMCGSYV